MSLSSRGLAALVLLAACVGNVGDNDGGGGAGGGSGGVAIAITAPSNGALVRGTVNVQVGFSGNPDTVVLLEDGAQVASLSAPSFAYAWDTTTIPDGTHAFVARATLAGQQTDSAGVSLTVDNTAPTVVARAPDPAAQELLAGGPLSITFSEAMSQTSVTASSLILKPNDGAGTPLTYTSTWSSDGKTLSVALVAPLTPPDRLQVATTNAITDLAGNPLVAAPVTYALAVWTSGPAFDTGATASTLYPVIAFDGLTAYVAYASLDSGVGQIHVRVDKRAPGEAPVALGAPLGSGDTATPYPSIAVDGMGRPVVAWMEGSGATETVHTARFEGGAWADLGMAAGANPVLTTDRSGVVYEAWRDDSTTPPKIHVTKLSGAMSQSAGPDLAYAGTVDTVSLSPGRHSLGVDSTGKLYLAWSERTTTLKVQVAGLAPGDTAWQPLGSALNVETTSDARWPWLSVAPNGDVFVGWTEVASNLQYHAHVARLDNTGSATWRLVGRPLNLDVNSTACWTSLATDSTSAPIVAWWEDVRGQPSLFVARWSGTAWAFLGGDQLSARLDHNAWAPQLALDSAGNPGVVFHDYDLPPSTASRAYLRRYNAVPQPQFGLPLRTASACQLFDVDGGPFLQLSQTGCFAYDGGGLPVPVTGLIPYELNSALWSDGAAKRRFIVLPQGADVTYVDAGAFDLPVGSFVIKEFAWQHYPDEHTRYPMETRFLFRRGPISWEGYSYQWDDALTDGFLMPAGNPPDGGTFFTKDWYDDAGTPHTQVYPTRASCLRCHNGDAGVMLGLQAGNLNRRVAYGAVADEQLRALSHAGVFGNVALPAPMTDLPRFTAPADVTEPLELRVRGYLTANCSQCHNPGGERPTRDFRWETPLASTALCSGEVVIGNASASLIHTRLTQRPGGMPPLASLVVDTYAVSVVDAWINSLTSCP